MPLAEGYVHDLDAMLAEITAATQLVCVNNPNNPTGTHLPASRIAAFLRAGPRARHGRSLDEAYIEFQTNDDPDDTVDFLERFPNLVLLRTFSKVYGLAGLRCGYALGSAKFRAAVDAVRQPFSVNELAQAAAAEALLHGDDVAGGSSGRSSSASSSRRGRGTSASTRRTHRPTSRGSPSATTTRPRSSSSLGERGIVVRGGAALGGPGHIRVTYGTRARERALPRGARGGRVVSAELLDYSGRTCYKTSAMNRASTSAYLTAPQGARPRAWFYFWRFS